MILLDTNVISELMRPAPNPAVVAWLDDQLESSLFLPVIAKAEIELGIALVADGKRKKGLQRAADEIFAVFVDRCLSLDRDAATRYPRKSS
jgi:predicted nucleic acid-binding protein